MAEFLEDRTVPATFTWNGSGTNDLWSNGANWVGGTAPSAVNFDDLVFPAGGNRLANTNDFSGARFKSITISGANYNLQGQALTLGNATSGTGFITANNGGGSSSTISLNISMGGAALNKQFFTVSQNGANLIISGRLSGATGVELTKSGVGRLILSGDNSLFNSPITVSAGTLNVRHVNALGTTNLSTTVQANATLQVENVTGTLLEPLRLNGPGTNNLGALYNVAGNNNWGATITLDSNSTIGAAGGTDFLISGQITDTGAGRNLTKADFGRVILGRDNTYRGLTIVSQGNLTVRNPLSLGPANAPASGGTVVNQNSIGGGTLEIEDIAGTGFTIVGEPLTLNGSGVNAGGNGALYNKAGNNTWTGVVTLGSVAPAGVDVQIGVAANTSLTISGVVQSPLRPATTLTKILPGTLIFTASNTYTGATIVAAGILNIRDSRGLGSSAAAGPTTVNAGATLEYEIDSLVDSVTGTVNRLHVSEVITFSGRGFGNVGAIHSKTGINRQLGNITSAGGTIGVDLDPNASSLDTYYTTDYSLTVASVISGSTLGKLRDGHLILINANTYTGATAIEEGWVTIENNAALGARTGGIGDTVQPKTTVFNGAALHLKAPTPAGTLTLVENLVLNGFGVSHPNKKLDHKGALLNVGGDNLVGGYNTLTGTIELQNGAGIGVELVSPATFSRLTLTGQTFSTTPVNFTINRNQISGGRAEDKLPLDTGARKGTVTLNYNFSAASTLTVYYEGVAIYTGTVNGVGTTGALAYGGVAGGSSTQLLVVVNEGVVAPIAGLTWNYSIVGAPLAANVYPGLTKFGTKRLVMQGDGTYVGDTFIEEGVLRIQHDTALGALNSNTTVRDGTALEIGNSVPQQAGGVTAGIQIGRTEHLYLTGPGNTTADGVLVPTLRALDGDQLWRGPITVAGTVNIVTEADTRLMLLGPIDDGLTATPVGPVADLNKLGIGKLVLGGANTYRGVTNVTSGIVNLQNPQALGYSDATAASGTVVASGASLEIQGTISIGGEHLQVQGPGATPTPNIVPRWFEQGPGPILNGQTPGNEPVTGRITSVQVDQSDPNVIYVATAGGGAFRTIDGGKTWLPLIDDAYNQAAAANLNVDNKSLVGGSIAVSTSDPRIVYFASGEGNNSGDSYVGRGVYKSIDSGKTWTQLLTPLAMVATPADQNPLHRLAITKLVIHPADNDVVFVSTSSYSVYNRGTAVAGIYRFTNGTGQGLGWYNMTGRTPGLLAAFIVNTVSVKRTGLGETVPGPDEDIAMDFPEDGVYSDLFVTPNRQVWTGPPGPNAFFYGPEIFFAIGTPDYAPGDNDMNAVYHTTDVLATDPFGNRPEWRVSDGVTALGGGAATLPNAYNTSLVARDRWNETIRIAYSLGTNIPSDADPNTTLGTVYAVITQPNFILFPFVQGNPNAGGVFEIWRSRSFIDLNPLPIIDPMGEDWVRVNTPPLDHLFPQGSYGSTLIVDPLNTDRLFIAGVDLIYMSTDGATSWVDVSIGANGKAPHADHHSMTFDSLGRLLVGTDGGVWRLDSTAPVTWTNLNGDLASVTIVGLDVHPFDHEQALIGTQDNGREIFVNGVWTRTAGGDGGYAVIDPLNPDIRYGQFQNGFFERSNDGGNTWTPINAGLPGGASFYVPFAIDRINTARLLVGETEVYETLDQGNTWNPMGAGIGAPIVWVSPAQYQGVFLPDPQFPSATDLGADTYVPDTTWAVTRNDVFLTKDHGSSWQNRTGVGGPSSAISHLAVDPRNRDTAFVTRAAFGGPKVFYTKDAAQTAWVDISGNLPDLPTNQVVVDPRSGDVFVGNDDGVYRLKGLDLAAGTYVWTRYGTGLPTVRVTQLVLNQNLDTLTVGSYGRGMFTLWLDPSQDQPVVPAALLAVSGSSSWTGPIVLQGPTVVGARGTQDIQNGLASASLEITGDISGPAAATLTKVGGGRVLLGGDNTYDGDTIVQEGVLGVRHLHALGSTVGQTFVRFGAALEMEASIEAETLHLKGQGFEFNGHRTGSLRNVTGDNTYGGPIILETDAPLTQNTITIGVDSGSSLRITGQITDGAQSLNLSKELTGRLILDPTAITNTYDGITEVIQGALAVAKPGALGTGGSAASGTVVYSGAQLQLEGNVTVPTEHLTLSGTGIFDTGALQNFSGNNTWAGPVLLTNVPGFSPVTPFSPDIAIGVLNAGETLTITGIISDANPGFGIRKVLPGELILAVSANTYRGTTTVEDGILDIRHNQSLGTTAGGTVVLDGATLELFGGITVAGEALTLNGLGDNGIGALFNEAGTNAWNGSVSLATTSEISAAAGTVLGIGGVVSGPATSDLIKDDAGIVSLGGANTFDGHTYVNDGILRVENAAALGAFGTQANGTTVADGATLQLFDSVGFGLTMNAEVLELSGMGDGGIGALQSGQGTTTWTGPITLLADASIGADGTFGGGFLEIPAAIDDGGNGFDLFKVGDGIAQLSGSVSNTYTGLTQVNDGLLWLNKNPGFTPFQGDLRVGDTIGTPSSANVTLFQADQIPDTSIVTVESDGTLQLNDLNETIGTLNVNDGEVAVGTTADLTVNSLNMVGGSVDTGLTGTNLFLTGDVSATSSGTESALIQGTGLIDFGGDRTFAVTDGPLPSDLIVDAPFGGADELLKAGTGVMELNADNVAAGYTGLAKVAQGTLQVDGTLGNIELLGGTISGDGTVGTITAAPVGTVNPGATVGTLTSNDVTLSNGSFFFVDLVNSVAGQFDVLVVNGHIDLNSATIIGKVDPSFPVNVPVRIIEATSVGASQFQQGLVAFIDGQKFEILYTGTYVELTKKKNNATVAVTDNVDPSVYGQQVIYTVSFTPEPGAGPVPDGSIVEFTYDGGAPINLAVVGGVATYTAPNPQTLGNHVVSATLLENTTFSAASSAPETHTVNPAQTTVTVSTNPLQNVATPVFGQTFDILATVAAVFPGSGIPTGTVTFRIDGGAPLPATVNTLTGVATLNVPGGLSVGLHTVSVSYGGDGNYLPSSTGLDYQIDVKKANSAVNLTASPASPQVLGTAVTFQAAVTAIAPGAGIPTGFVNFFDGVTPIGSGSLNAAGVATFTISTLSGGAHTITAQYVGDTRFVLSAGSLPYTVSPGASSTSLVALPVSPTAFGQSVTFTATVVSGVGGLYQPTGTVSFFLDGSAIPAFVGTVDGAGVASFSTTTLSAISHTILAVYNGDVNFQTSNTSIGHIVTLATTTTTIVSNVTPTSQYGQNVTFTTTVAPVAPATLIPTGTLTYIVDGTPLLLPGTLNAAGVATLVIGNLLPGAHTIEAQYTGDAAYAAAVAPFTTISQVVVKGDVNATVTTSQTPSVFGQPVTFTANVAAIFGAGVIPTGQVVFNANGTAIGAPVTLNASGVATLTISSIAVGSSAITVDYLGDANYNVKTSAPITQVVNRALTTTALTTTTLNGVFGQPVIRATVTATAPSAAIPTGDVTFTLVKVGVATPIIVTVPLDAAGVATLPNLDVGVYTSIRATYALQPNFFGSVSNTLLNQTITQASSTTTVATSGSPVVYSSPVTFTATVVANAPSTAIPTGNVTFFVNGSASANVALDPTGKATFSTSTLPVGTHQVVAQFDGTGNIAASTSSFLFQVITVAPTTTSLVANPVSPTVSGQPVTFTATITPNIPATGTPTGNVVFTVDGTPQAPIPLTSGVASIVVPGLTAAGSAHTIIAAYLGDGNYSASSQTLSHTVNAGTSSVALSTSVNPSVFGQSVNLNAVVSAVAPAVGTPIGTVTFFEGLVNLGTATLVSGTATLPFSSFSVGLHTIHAVYNGSAEFGTATSANATQTVNQATSAASVASSLNPSVYGNNVTFTATLSALAPGAGTPTGTVNFIVDGLSIGTGPLAGGIATLTTNALNAGFRSVTVSYSGDVNFTASASAPFTQTVNQGPTQTVVASSNPNAQFGQPSITATVTSPTGGVANRTGTVTFTVTPTVGSPTTFTVPVTGTGVATLPSLLPGTYTISATYNGDANYLASASTSITQIVNKGNTSTSVSSSANPSVFGQNVTLTATVAAVSPAFGTPTGTVTFTAGATTLGTGTLNGSGVATISVSSLAVATHNIVATYSADPAFNASSVGISQTVNKANTTPSVNVDISPSIVTQLVTYSITMLPAAPGGGIPSGSVTLKVNGTIQATAVLDGNGQASLSFAFPSVGTQTISIEYSGGPNHNASATTFAQVVNPNPVVVATLPASVRSGQAFTATVNYTDPFGAIDPSYNGPITLSLASGPAAFAPVTVNAIAGTAIFNNLVLAKAGTYFFQAAAGTLPAVAAAPLAVTFSTLTAALSTLSPLVNTGVNLTIVARDITSAVATNATGVPVTVSVVTKPLNGGVTGPLTGTLNNGLLSLAGLKFTRGGTYVLQITANGISTFLTVNVTGRVT